MSAEPLPSEAVLEAHAAAVPGTTMVRLILIALAASFAVFGPASAQTPPTTTTPSPSSTATGAARGAPYTATPTATGPRSGPPRRRSFEFCNKDAQVRRLRGPERRHFVSRCQLGYGRPLFRRRGSIPN